MCVSGVFTECHSSDEARAQKLLVRVSHFWGRTTCLRLALEADDKSFVAQCGVQVVEKKPGVKKSYKTKKNGSKFQPSYDIDGSCKISCFK